MCEFFRVKTAALNRCRLVCVPNPRVYTQSRITMISLRTHVKDPVVQARVRRITGTRKDLARILNCGLSLKAARPPGR